MNEKETETGADSTADPLHTLMNWWKTRIWPSIKLASTPRSVMHPISQVKSVGEKMEALPALEEKECKGPNGSVANFGSRCRKYRRSGSHGKDWDVVCRKGSRRVSINEPLAPWSSGWLSSNSCWGSRSSTPAGVREEREVWFCSRIF